MISESYILIIEDSKELRSTLGDLYQNEGYDVVLAAEGEEAFKKIAERNELPSLILLDMMMPGMNGKQFRKKQQQDIRLGSIPVVIMTAAVNAQETAKTINANGYICKPADIDVFLAVAEKYCEKI